MKFPVNQENIPQVTGLFPNQCQILKIGNVNITNLGKYYLDWLWKLNFQSLYIAAWGNLGQLVVRKDEKIIQVAKEWKRKRDSGSHLLSRELNSLLLHACVTLSYIDMQLTSILDIGRMNSIHNPSSDVLLSLLIGLICCSQYNPAYLKWTSNDW